MSSGFVIRTINSKKKTVRLDSKTEQLIIKYLSDSASVAEMEALVQWLEDPENEQLFRDFVKTNYAIDFTMKSFDTNVAKEKLLKKVRKNRSTFFGAGMRVALKYAAVIVLLLAAVYFYSSGLFKTQPEKLVINDESITLQLEDGSVQIIEENASLDITDATGKIIGRQTGNAIRYGEMAAAETISYNEITVPYGKRFTIQLSDGSEVQLNAGTRLRYPVHFLNGRQREVFLNGEAYFDVARDIDHPFIVNSTAINVAVLGTQFNISSYPEDKLTDVVLVEGAVAMYPQSGMTRDSTFLTPGLKGSFNKVNMTFTTEKVNTSVYTSWRNGELVFRNSPFKHIVKKLERHYNIRVVLNNEELGEELFSASFTDKNIREVLSYFDFIKRIDYTLKDNTVYINESE